MTHDALNHNEDCDDGDKLYIVSDIHSRKIKRQKSTQKAKQNKPENKTTHKVTRRKKRIGSVAVFPFGRPHQKVRHIYGPFFLQDEKKNEFSMFHLGVL